jgi:hypothetical protein
MAGAETAHHVAIPGVAAGTNPVVAAITETADGSQVFLPQSHQFLPLGPVPFSGDRAVFCQRSFRDQSNFR